MVEGGDEHSVQQMLRGKSPRRKPRPWRKPAVNRSLALRPGAIPDSSCSLSGYSSRFLGADRSSGTASFKQASDVLTNPLLLTKQHRYILNVQSERHFYKSCLATQVCLHCTIQMISFITLLFIIYDLLFIIYYLLFVICYLIFSIWAQEGYISLLTSKLNIERRNKLIIGYVWSIVSWLRYLDTRKIGVEVFGEL